MLILKRRPGQAFRIGAGESAVWVYVAPVQKHRGQVAIAVHAPGQRVIREELVEEKGPWFNEKCYPDSDGLDKDGS